MEDFAEYADDVLLMAFAQLTHRLHAARDSDDPTLEIRLRDERDELRDVILRRMAEGRS